MDRLRNLWSAFYDAFVRENRVLPPVVALLALFLFAWVVAGAFVDESGDENTSGEADLVQSREPSGDTPIAPEAEDRDADSYAAYRNKDPFRQLFAPAEAAPEETSQENTTDETTTGETTTPETTAPGGTTTGNGGGNTGGGGAGQRSRTDSDGDGLTNRLEKRLGQDPRDPDTDDDGTEDGADDSDNDGVPDGQRNNAGGGGAGTGGGTGTGTGGGAGAGGNGAGGGGNGGANGSDDELFDSGGGKYLR